MIRRIFKLLFILVAIAFVERLCHQATDGFACVNIYAPPGDNSKWKENIPPNEREQIKLILAQPFHYLNCGSQSYVFVSEDGQTVLKLFKFQHMRIPPWIAALPLPEKLAEKRKAKEEKKRAVLEATFNSIHIAYHLMRTQTGLLYIHLDKTQSLNQTVTITDKIGKHHTLDLDQVEFILQKRASLAYETLNNLMENREIEKAKQALSSLLKLAVSRCQKGIFDKDPDFSTNFGFVGEVPIQIDFGRLSLLEEEKNPAIYGPEMIRITREFQKWIEKNHPELLNFFNIEIKKITQLS